MTLRYAPIRAFVKRIAKANSFWSLFACLLVLMLCCIPPNGVLSMNEEVYLTMAEKEYAPQEYGPHTGFTEGSDTRLLFNFPYGWVVNTFGAAPAQMMGRLLLVFGFAWTVTMLARRLSLHVLDVTLSVMAFYLLRQYILGQDWIFVSIESKPLAYVFLFAAMALALDGRLIWAAVLSALGTYMHFQAAGNWWLFIVAWQFFFEKRRRQSLMAMGVYLLLCVPEMAVIISEYGSSLGMTATASNGWTSDYIYSAWRIPHHVAPFASLGRLSLWAPGIAMLFGLSVTVFWIWKGEDDPKSRSLSGLILIALLTMVFFLVAMVFDRGFALGKLYPFRPSSIALLLTLFLGCMILARRFCHQATHFKALIAVILLPIFLAKAGNAALEPLLDEHRLRREQHAVMEWMTSSLPEDAVLLVDAPLEARFLRLERDHSIPMWANVRAIPTKPMAVVSWFSRGQAQEKAFSEGCHGVDLGPVTHMLASKDKVARLAPSCGEVVHKDSRFGVIAVDSP